MSFYVEPAGRAGECVRARAGAVPPGPLARREHVGRSGWGPRDHPAGRQPRAGPRRSAMSVRICAWSSWSKVKGRANVTSSTSR